MIKLTFFSICLAIFEESSIIVDDKVWLDEEIVVFLIKAWRLHANPQNTTLQTILELGVRINNNFFGKINTNVL